MQAQVEDPSS